MTTDTQQRWLSRVALAATVALCAHASSAVAAEDGRESMLPGSDSHRLVHNRPMPADAPAEMHPGTPMMLDPGFAGFPFTADGGEPRRLQLRLTQPLILEMGSQARTASETALLGLDATLQIPVTQGVNLTTRVDQTLAAERFQTLGSIHCNNGILRSDSYTASGCRFVNDTASQFDRRTLSMGPQFDIGNISTSLRWFTSDTQYRPGAPAPLSPWRSSVLLDPGMTALENIGPVLPGSMGSTLSGETTGIDLDFQVGFTTDQAGEVRLGLALTRVYDAAYDGFGLGGFNPIQWNIAAPFNTARFGVEWTRGAFSSGVRGYYREPVSFLDRSSLDGMGTFDVHFTWRTPWNANLSVGASNVLNAGGETRSPADTKPADRFESIYGRIPYVRYQQDL